MNERGKVLAVLGVVIVLSSYVFNEIFMMLFFDTNYIPPGPHPHSQPPIVGTAWLFLVPVGFMLVFISIALELRDRFRRTDTTEIWEQ